MAFRSMVEAHVAARTRKQDDRNQSSCVFRFSVRKLADKLLNLPILRIGSTSSEKYVG